MADILYSKGRYTVQHNIGNYHYSIYDGEFRLEGYAPSTLGVAKSLVNDLCRCVVCDGNKMTVCRECKGDGTIYSNEFNWSTQLGGKRSRGRVSLTCNYCLGSGYTKCEHCTGSGMEPG